MTLIRLTAPEQDWARERRSRAVRLAKFRAAEAVELHQRLIAYVHTSRRCHVNAKRLGLLGLSELERINKRLRALEQHPLSGSDEILLASAARRAQDLRGSVTTLTLGLSVLALAVAVIIGGFGANEYLALFLIAYLFIGGALGLVGIRLMDHAATAEITRALVERRLALASETRRALQDADAVRRSNEASQRGCFLRRLSARTAERAPRTQ